MCETGKVVPWPLCSVLNHSEIDNAVSRFLKLMFLSVLSFWAISLIVNGSTWGGLAMMLKLCQASLAVLERGFECQLRDCEEKLKLCFRVISGF